ncbi:hypothetical protein TNCV_825641 [Trichonephila clavipes]|nr:hypothetical protein TNCV_825641 [Trichonephila clavipes]
MSLKYRCAVSMLHDDERGPNVKRKVTPDHNSWLRDYVAYNSESRIGTLTWVSPDTSSTIPSVNGHGGHSCAGRPYDCSKDESGTVTADLTVNLSSRSAAALGQPLPS